MIGLLLLAASSIAGVVDRIAAVVNGDVITLTEVYELGGEFIEQRAAEGVDPSLRREGELEVLDSLILRRLISQEITRLGLDVTEVELNRSIDDIAQRNGMARDQLELEIERTGLPWAEYRAELKENLRQMKFNQAVMQPRITVNEDELKDAFRRLITAAELPEVVELGAIFLAAPPLPPEVDLATLAPDIRAEAQRMIREAETAAVQQAEKLAAIQERIAAGEDFAEIAALADEGPYGAQGGKMGTYRQGELVETLDAPAFALQAGELSAPVVTGQGTFLLYVFDRYPEEPPPFDEVRDRLFEQVYSERIESETEIWYQQSRRKSAVLIKLEDPG
ncbi:MAG: peptidyl-prolyl cis-trans isomerase [Myxococcota bacterium]|nr:peptidyl-prolyl cis-trans isomerase [Myxococcota bacterium]